MATDVELDRIAAAVGILRPDWHPKSIGTWLRSTEAGRAVALRPYPDLAVAFVACALDPRSGKPARVAEAGPWWHAVARTSERETGWLPGPGDERPCRRPGHEHEIARACRACRAEQLAGDEHDVPAPIVPAPPRTTALTERTTPDV